MEEQEIFFSLWQAKWQEASPAARRRGRIALGVYLLFTLVGTIVAASQVAALAEMSEAGRWMGAVGMGPFGLLWAGLKLTGLLMENSGDPGIGWMLPAALHIAPYAILIGVGPRPLPAHFQQQRQMKAHRRQQGQLEEAEAAARLATRSGVVMAVVRDANRRPVMVGRPFADQGHLLVTAPTRSGKGLNLTEVLLHWPGAAVVVDPKAEQWARTAGFRRRYLGPVYHLPGHQIPLSRYFNLNDADDLQELHGQLLRPDQDLQRIFADKSLSLMQAVAHFAAARRLDPLRVLLDVAADDWQQVLLGLDAAPAARPFLRQFTNGQSPQAVMASDRFVASAYGTFTTRLFGYQKHIDTICPRAPQWTLPQEWALQRATVYLTYSLNELQGVGGVVAAILAGLMRDHMKHGRRAPLLIAIDEMAAVRLRNLETYLATVGGYGITLLLYAQSAAQLEEIYGRAGAESIRANCAHQLWYRPNNIETAQHISDLYGTALVPNHSYSIVQRLMRQENGQTVTIPQQSVNQSLVEKPAYAPSEVIAIAEEQVFVFTQQGQQVRFVGQRLDNREMFPNLPPAPPPPRPSAAPRQYTEWMAAGAEAAPAAPAAAEPAEANEPLENGAPTTAEEAAADAAAAPDGDADVADRDLH